MSSSNEDFSRGDKVEANFGGKGKWYKGKVTAAHSNGTYDILYEDGDRERGVKAENLRSVGGVSGGGSASGQSFSRGDKVEANFGGNGKWYKAKITYKSSGGTYDL